ncbi:MAG: DNA-directed DNA polymerase II small subunit [Thermoplasmata archaeon]
MKRTILRTLTEKGILADPDALDALAKLPNPMDCVRAILNDGEHRPLVLSRTDVENYVSRLVDSGSASPPKQPARNEAEESAPRSGTISVLKDITGNSTCIGNVIDFAKLFNDRFTTLKRLIARRREMSGLVTIARAKKVQRDVRFVGMVNDVRTTKNGHTLLELEDEDDRIQVLIMKGARQLPDSFVKDEVVGIVGSFSKDGELVVAKDVVRPDVPINSGMVPNGSRSILAFVSDIHVGSTEFLSEEWNRFVKWLNEDPVAKDIRYMVVAGDLVDGIGIYPNQEEELLIEDVYAQYAELARLVAPIPHWIKIVMMPGNHDAVRLAEPQPALPKEVTMMFEPRVMFVGNPCYLEIEGRTVLAYHGRSMDDFISNVRKLSHSAPGEIMKEMLKRRHMAPIYGEKTALAPEQKDYLVIDRVPDIFVTGHVHACSVGEYRGIKLINASAWQAQTAFQRMHNQIPDPAKVVLTRLGTGETWVEDFSS